MSINHKISDEDSLREAIKILHDAKFGYEGLIYNSKEKTSEGWFAIRCCISGRIFMKFEESPSGYLKDT